MSLLEKFLLTSNLISCIFYWNNGLDENDPEGIENLNNSDEQTKAT